MNRPPRFIDISMPITPEMPVFPGDPSPSFSVTEEAGVTMTVLCLPLHAGTHVDTPLHVLPGGDHTGGLAPDRLCGPACVVQARRSPIDAAQVRDWPLRARDRVLVRRAPGGCTFTLDGAQALLETELLLLGMEDFGPDAVSDPLLPVHRLLLGHRVLLLENLCLEAAPPGRYHLTCLGPRLPRSEAVCVRAVLSW